MKNIIVILIFMSVFTGCLIDTTITDGNYFEVEVISVKENSLIISHEDFQFIELHTSEDILNYVKDRYEEYTFSLEIYDNYIIKAMTDSKIRRD